MGQDELAIAHLRPPTPVRRYDPTRTPVYSDLVDRLADEWRAANSVSTEPVILEEPDRDGTIRHVYVIWDDWASLPSQTRGEIIMDAVERVKSRPAVLDITIAMGLTADEADRFQLKWR